MKAIYWNGVSSVVGKGSFAVVRILQVGVLIRLIGGDEYGRWLLISSIPGWLALANMGFGNVAANAVSMHYAQGELEKAKNVYSSVAALLVGLITFCILLVIPLAGIVHWSVLLKAPSDRGLEMQHAAFLLVLAMLFSFWGEIYTCRFRAARKAHLGMLLGAVRPWIELGAMVGVLQFSKRFDFLAGAVLFSTFIFVLLSSYFSSRVLPELKFSRLHVRRGEFPHLIRKGMAFQAFPLGNAILFQGALLIVQAVLGPFAVALFGTARTLVRSVNQVMEMINQSVWPEMSLALGAGDYANAARLHRVSVLLSFIAATSCTLALILFGRQIFQIWTHAELELTRIQLLLFLIPIPVNALWYTSSVVHAACNQHEALAVRYLIATSCGAVACYVFTLWWGLNGAALSTLVVELILAPFVFYRSLKITKDSLDSFRAGLGSDLRYWIKKVA